ncbi:Uu.00g120540.m01.CDS01 [Anthostomella pinea]|uniref:Uu.00g120540.m01.CDS01 n=1 Tax=Anthostomella pinea TaxID=933095 RepID=A0AAI8VHT3_9PEZI|nr:Uu.00g120540.m01.CDS01 [Anthostomella pinea]
MGGGSQDGKRRQSAISCTELDEERSTMGRQCWPRDEAVVTYSKDKNQTWQREEMSMMQKPQAPQL